MRGEPALSGKVADTGPGLTAEQSARVFERFYRVDASRSRQEGGGAGLGLAIVSALTTAHQGTVELQTAPGEGALFRVYLPSTPQRQPAEWRVLPGSREPLSAAAQGIARSRRSRWGAVRFTSQRWRVPVRHNVRATRTS